MEKPKVSVIMPIYNAERFVEAAITSITAQTYKNFEIVLVDDCSIDNTMEVIKRIKDDRIKIIHNKKNQGIAYSRNIAIESSCGEYVAIMDDDDIASRNRLELEVDFLDRHRDIDVVGGRKCVIDENGEVIRPSRMVYYNPKYIKAKYLFQNVFHNGTVMFRRKPIMQNGISYKNAYLGMEDYRFWVECSKVVQMSNIDEIFLYHREYENNETSRVSREANDERRRLYSEIQRFSLWASGYHLEENELMLLTEVLKEKNGCYKNKEEMQAFYDVLCKILRQSQEMNCDNLKEIELVCKELFAEKTKNARFLWNNVMES